MAGDWIKIEKATPRKPEVLRIASMLGIHPDHAFGICFRFWSWCDDNLKTCNAPGVTDVMLDALLGRDGCASALIEVGWLQVRNSSLVIPNFDRHLSESSKKRALSAERTANSRSRKCNAENVTESLPEKRREEKSIKRERGGPKNENEIVLSEDLEAAWKRWKNHSSDKGKVINAVSEQTQLLKLCQAYPNDGDRVLAIEHAIVRNWANINLGGDHSKPDVQIGSGNAYSKRVKENQDEFERLLGKGSK
jgi:hypothetical protein